MDFLLCQGAPLGSRMTSRLQKEELINKGMIRVHVFAQFLVKISFFISIDV